MVKITFLGTGASSGTPSVDRGWGGCDPENPKNRRLRPSILVESNTSTVLVDTSPDLRQQLLNAKIQHLDGVLYTHYHADHLHGIDDLRPINRISNKPLDCFADLETMRVIEERFGYVMEPVAPEATVVYKPTLIPHTIGHGAKISIGDIDIQVFVQDHGHCETLGYRFGNIAYSTDVTALSDAAFDIVQGVDTWIIGTLTDAPHPTHADIDKAIAWIGRVGAKQGYLTHLSFNLDHATLEARLPAHVRPAYDGLVIEG